MFLYWTDREHPNTCPMGAEHMPGTGAYNVLRTLMYEYCRLRYDASLSSERLRVGGRTSGMGIRSAAERYIREMYTEVDTPPAMCAEISAINGMFRISFMLSD